MKSEAAAEKDGAASAAPDILPARRRPLPPRKRSVSWQDRYLPGLISVTSVAAVVFLVAYLVGNSAAWPRIQAQFFNLEAMQQAFPRVLRGFWTNLWLWGAGLVAIGVWALVLAVMRSMSGPWFAPLRVFTMVYVDLFRGIPALLLVLLFGFGIPALNLPGLPSSGLFWGFTAMVLSYSAYACEIYRSGIDAVHDGQRAAAKALGLNQWQTMWYAVLPQAIRNIVPALLNLVVALQKDVVLLSVIGVRDAVREAQIFTASTFNYSSLVVAALLFMATSIPLARLTDYLARRDRVRRLQGAG